MKREDGHVLLIGMVLLFAWMSGTHGGKGSFLGGPKGGVDRGGKTTKKPKTKGPTKDDDHVDVEVDSPGRRPATPEEIRKYGNGTPAGMISASPELEAPRHGQTPVGYDAGTARAQARGIAAHLAAKGPRAYDRNRLATWQTFAGLRADGNYGGSTRGALVHYGVTSPPRPFLSPYATLPYHPPE